MFGAPKNWFDELLREYRYWFRLNLRFRWTNLVKAIRRLHRPPPPPPELPYKTIITIITIIHRKRFREWNPFRRSAELVLPETTFEHNGGGGGGKKKKSLRRKTVKTALFGAALISQGANLINAFTRGPRVCDCVSEKKKMRFCRRLLIKCSRNAAIGAGEGRQREREREKRFLITIIYVRFPF